MISSQHCICQTFDSGISTGLRQNRRRSTVCRWQHVPWGRAGSHPTFSTFSQGGSSDPGQPHLAPPPWATSPVGSGFGMSLHHASCPPFPQGRRLFSVAPRGLQKPCPTLPWVILKCPSDHMPPPSAGRVFAEPRAHRPCSSHTEHPAICSHRRGQRGTERQDPGQPPSCSCPLPILPPTLLGARAQWGWRPRPRKALPPRAPKWSSPGHRDPMPRKPAGPGTSPDQKLLPILLFPSMSLVSRGPQQKGCSPWHLSAPRGLLAMPLQGARGSYEVVMAGGRASPVLTGPDAPTPSNTCRATSFPAKSGLPGPHACRGCQAAPLAPLCPFQAGLWVACFPLPPPQAVVPAFCSPESQRDAWSSARDGARGGDSQTRYDNRTLTRDLQHPVREARELCTMSPRQPGLH